jgi:Zn-dependent metalloprotease
MHTPPLTRWVRPRLAPLALALVFVPLGAGLLGQQADTAVRRGPTAVAAADRVAAVAWAQRIDAMQRAGSLRLASSREDTMLPGRVHDRFDQYAGDVPIFGAQLVRQRSADGVETVFGSIYPDDLGISLQPKLSLEDAVARVATLAGHAPHGRGPTLMVLPREDGTFTLVWSSRVRADKDIVALFIDAQTGEEVLRYSAIRRQSAVGTGTGVLGDRKKLATRRASDTHFADDLLRPPVLVTYDLKGNFDRAFNIIVNNIQPAQSDIAVDSDNTWTDGAVVDGHAYVGYTYDYLFARFDRRGLDGNNRPVRAIVHPANRTDVETLPDFAIENFLLNAFWCGDDCNGGPNNYMVFGDGLTTRYVSGGQFVNFFSASMDIVAHELAHGVTEYTSGLIYLNESGALNEAFSDVIGIGAEYYVRASGRSDRTPDYIVGEDVFTPSRVGVPTGIRALDNPGVFGDPDHYSRRYVGPIDNGGVHSNSLIAGHAFYLAIEGGTNRTSGLAVQGVGPANRQQIERVFFRGFTQYLTPTATFAQARQATVRAAQELYGNTSEAARAVTQAWTAVGVF